MKAIVESTREAIVVARADMDGKPARREPAPGERPAAARGSEPPGPLPGRRASGQCWDARGQRLLEEVEGFREGQVVKAQPARLRGLEHGLERPTHGIQGTAQGQRQRALHSLALGQPLQLLVTVQLAVERGQRTGLRPCVLGPLGVLERAPGELPVADDGRLGGAHQLAQPTHRASRRQELVKGLVSACIREHYARSIE